MIKLYGNPYSSNSRKIHFALEESGATYEYKNVDIPSGAHKQPDFLAMNPNGKVPVIDDDGFILWESNAILWYVADRHGKGKLIPTDPKERAWIDQWMFWQYAELSPVVARPWLMKFMSKFGQKYDEAEHAKLCQAAVKPLGVLDAHLATRKHLVGEPFTIGDIAVAEVVNLAEDGGIPLEPFKHVRAWLGRVSERPAFGKTRPPRA